MHYPRQARRAEPRRPRRCWPGSQLRPRSPRSDVIAFVVAAGRPLRARERKKAHAGCQRRGRVCDGQRRRGQSDDIGQERGRRGQRRRISHDRIASRDINRVNAHVSLYPGQSIGLPQAVSPGEHEPERFPAGALRIGQGPIGRRSRAQAGACHRLRHRGRVDRDGPSSAVLPVGIAGRGLTGNRIRD